MNAEKREIEMNGMRREIERPARKFKNQVEGIASWSGKEAKKKRQVLSQLA